MIENFYAKLGLAPSCGAEAVRAALGRIQIVDAPAPDGAGPNGPDGEGPIGVDGPTAEAMLDALSDEGDRAEYDLRLKISRPDLKFSDAVERRYALFAQMRVRSAGAGPEASAPGPRRRSAPPTPAQIPVADDWVDQSAWQRGAGREGFAGVGAAAAEAGRSLSIAPGPSPSLSPSPSSGGSSGLLPQSASDSGLGAGETAQFPSSLSSPAPAPSDSAARAGGGAGGAPLRFSHLVFSGLSEEEQEKRRRREQAKEKAVREVWLASRGRVEGAAPAAASSGVSTVAPASSVAAAPAAPVSGFGNASAVPPSRPLGDIPVARDFADAPVVGAADLGPAGAALASASVSASGAELSAATPQPGGERQGPPIEAAASPSEPLARDRDPESVSQAGDERSPIQCFSDPAPVAPAPGAQAASVGPAPAQSEGEAHAFGAEPAPLVYPEAAEARFSRESDSVSGRIAGANPDSIPDARILSTPAPTRRAWPGADGGGLGSPAAQEGSSIRGFEAKEPEAREPVAAAAAAGDAAVSGPRGAWTHDAVDGAQAEEERVKPEAVSKSFAPLEDDEPDGARRERKRRKAKAASEPARAEVGDLGGEKRDGAAAMGLGRIVRRKGRAREEEARGFEKVGDDPLLTAGSFARTRDGAAQPKPNAPPESADFSDALPGILGEAGRALGSEAHERAAAAAPRRSDSASAQAESLRAPAPSPLDSAEAEIEVFDDVLGQENEVERASAPLRAQGAGTAVEPDGQARRAEPNELKESNNDAGLPGNGREGPDENLARAAAAQSDAPQDLDLGGGYVPEADGLGAESWPPRGAAAGSADYPPQPFEGGSPAHDMAADISPEELARRQLQLAEMEAEQEREREKRRAAEEAERAAEQALREDEAQRRVAGLNPDSGAKAAGSGGGEEAERPEREAADRARRRAEAASGMAAPGAQAGEPANAAESTNARGARVFGKAHSLRPFGRGGSEAGGAPGDAPREPDVGGSQADWMSDFAEAAQSDQGYSARLDDHGLSNALAKREGEKTEGFFGRLFKKGRPAGGPADPAPSSAARGGDGSLEGTGVADPAQTAAPQADAGVEGAEESAELGLSALNVVEPALSTEGFPAPGYGNSQGVVEQDGVWVMKKPKGRAPARAGGGVRSASAGAGAAGLGPTLAPSSPPRAGRGQGSEPAPGPAASRHAAASDGLGLKASDTAPESPRPGALSSGGSPTARLGEPAAGSAASDQRSGPEPAGSAEKRKASAASKAPKAPRAPEPSAAPQNGTSDAPPFDEADPPEEAAPAASTASDGPIASDGSIAPEARQDDRRPWHEKWRERRVMAGMKRDRARAGQARAGAETGRTPPARPAPSMAQAAKAVLAACAVLAVSYLGIDYAQNRDGKDGLSPVFFNEIKTAATGAAPTAAGFDEDSNTLWVGYADGSVRSYKGSGRAALDRLLNWPESRRYAAAMASMNEFHKGRGIPVSLVAPYGKGQDVLIDGHLWSLDGRVVTNEAAAPSAGGQTAAPVKQRKLLALVSAAASRQSGAPQKLSLVDLAAKTTLAETNLPPAARQTGVAASYDGTWLAALRSLDGGEGANQILVYRGYPSEFGDGLSLGLRANYLGDAERMRYAGAAFASGLNAIVIAGDDGVVRAWSLDSFAPIAGVESGVVDAAKFVYDQYNEAAWVLGKIAGASGRPAREGTGYAIGRVDLRAKRQSLYPVSLGRGAVMQTLGRSGKLWVADPASGKAMVLDRP